MSLAECVTDKTMISETVTSHPCELLGQLANRDHESLHEVGKVVSETYFTFVVILCCVFDILECIPGNSVVHGEAALRSLRRLSRI